MIELLPLAAVALIVTDGIQTAKIFRRGFGEKNPVIRLANSKFGKQGILLYYVLALLILVGLWSMKFSPEVSDLRTGATALFCVVQGLTCFSNRRLLRGK